MRDVFARNVVLRHHRRTEPDAADHIQPENPRLVLPSVVVCRLIFSLHQFGKTHENSHWRTDVSSCLASLVFRAFPDNMDNLGEPLDCLGSNLGYEERDETCVPALLVRAGGDEAAV
ncbi:uncharacterized protein PHACADRAFT_181177 [Phanerochaete carnosa HHB-10118-sp]|uniref:Uncharacterized protein n=1 Tax=Phanerochaete carnosa (strain HHB-10118-sp) TaxID=650164 RepID=K5W5I6_PHACS|nr:uncharacterized protein PHACADRAFT_181177 [Phanerochaete carnosa HHB-10118-sp]EKM59183.1 hypothetical protein PHACADRAFT_181177 [Phanerochaete carnosa HHB-10118-sp]